MYGYTIYYSCPKCGKSESSWDGYNFCGKCEEEYRRSDIYKEIAETERALKEGHLNRNVY